MNISKFVVIFFIALGASGAFAGTGCVDKEPIISPVNFTILNQGLAKGLTTVADIQYVNFQCNSKLLVTVRTSAPNLITVDLIERDDVGNILETVRIDPSFFEQIDSRTVEVSLEGGNYKNSVLTLRVGGFSAGAYLIH